MDSIKDLSNEDKFKLETTYYTKKEKKELKHLMKRINL